MVRATFSGLNTALSALQANQKRLDIVGQNLSNMYTTGYTRQQLNTSSLNYTGAISHYMNGSETNVGFGVSMDSVSQLRDPYLDAQYRYQMQKSNYTDSMQESLDSLAKVLDESNISGIRQAFDDIQSSLTNMQDLSKVVDPIYETELRSRVQALTNLLNSSAAQIEEAQKTEYDKLDGKGSSEQGAIQKVNDILRQIGDLNVEIKKNQVLGQPSLELQDERNVLLDELSSYVPIEVTYYKDDAHSGNKIYDYDSNGNIIGKKNWPDDMKVDLVYTDTNGDIQRLTLVNGSDLEDANGNRVKNYGSLTSVPADGQGAADRSNPTNAAVKFTAAESAAKTTGANTETTACASGSQFSGGSIQSSLDMLGKTGTGTTIGNTQNLDNVRGYQYYMDKLNVLAATFANTMNDLNNLNGNAGNLLTSHKNADGTVNTANAAATIGITKEWINGDAHVSTSGESQNDTVLAMLNSMTSGQAGLGNRSYADYINNVSTTLANDSSTNQTSLKTNVTVLNSIQDSRDSISGVSLDEEASNMMTYASAYSAASRLMTTMDQLLDVLINSTGTVGR